MAKTLRDETKAERKKVKAQLQAAGALGEPSRGLFEPRGNIEAPFASVQEWAAASGKATTSNAQMELL